MRYVFYADLFSRMQNLHPEKDCKGGACCVHRPSLHRMTTWPVTLDAVGQVHRVCSHGRPHIDPDSESFLAKTWNRAPIRCHYCDGCCGDPHRTVWTSVSDFETQTTQPNRMEMW